jgi:hypothetical protein
MQVFYDTQSFPVGNNVAKNQEQLSCVGIGLIFLLNLIENRRVAWAVPIYLGSLQKLVKNGLDGVPE